VAGSNLNKENSYGSGWSIGDATAAGSTSTWGTPATTYQLPLEIWATKK
jgi:hypothetical protein